MEPLLPLEGEEVGGEEARVSKAGLRQYAQERGGSGPPPPPRAPVAATPPSPLPSGSPAPAPPSAARDAGSPRPAAAGGAAALPPLLPPQLAALGACSQRSRHPLLPLPWDGPLRTKPVDRCVWVVREGREGGEGKGLAQAGVKNRLHKTNKKVAEFICCLQLKNKAREGKL